MKQRFLSVLLALTMLLTLMPATAVAAENEDGVDDSEIVYETHPGIGSIEDILPLSTPFSIVPGLAYTGSYYDQLDEKSKTLYDAIYNSELKNGPTKEAVTFTAIPYTDDTERQDILWSAIAALLYDHPELSWLVNTEFSTGRNGSSLVSFGLSENGYECATTSPTGLVTADNKSYANTGNRADVMDRIKAAKGEIGDLSGKSDYEKVKVLYDWVCNNMEYAHYRTNDPDYSEEEAAKFNNGWRGYQTSYSALVEGVTVCAGYAKSFKLLCDAYSIPCAIVTGKSSNQNHAWNYVQVGGSWYAIDCTWADQSTYINYDYLLKGKTNFTDHTEGTLYSTCNFTYPVLSTEDYKDPSAPASIDLTYTPPITGSTGDGTPFVFVQAITDLGTPSSKEITFTAVPKDADGSELSGQTVSWTMAPAYEGITLDTNDDGTATLAISNSAMAFCDQGRGYYVTVTASCGTTTASQKLVVGVSTRSAKFVRIYKGSTAITADTIVQGGSATYTATVYDQYGMPMDGGQIYDPNGNPVNRPEATAVWSVTGGTGVTVNNGAVTVAADAAAGNYTVTATSGSASASVTVTVAADTPAHTHSWSGEWDKDSTHHWHNCTAADCPETDNSKKDGYAAHTSDAGVVTKAPTCTEAGVKTFSCTECGYVIKTEPIASEGHKWSAAWEKDGTNHWHTCANCTEISSRAAHSFDSGVITTQPTYEAAGVRTYTCTTCQYQKSEAVAKLEHNYSSTWSKDENKHWHACTDTGYTDLRADEANHTWNAGEITTAPSYAAPGEKTLTCTICGQIKTEPVAQLVHKYSDQWSKNSDTHWHACIDAGFEHLKKDEAAHTWDAGVETTPPTADADGLKTYTCTACQQTKTETIGATGHTYSDAWTSNETEHWHACTDAGCDKVSGKAPHSWTEKSSTPATHDTDGSRTLQCVCGAEKTEILPKHTVSPLWSSDADYHWHACTESGCTEKGGLAEHNWDSGTVITAPTLEAAGEKKFTCADCNRTKLETLAQLEHTYSSEWSKDDDYHWHACTDAGYESLIQDKALHTWNAGVVTTEPTTETEGVRTYTCTVCGQTKTESIAQLGHTHDWAAEWSKDETGHWHACTSAACTGRDSFAAHDYDNDADTTCNICGYIRTLAPTTHTHSWNTGAWSTSSTHHWHECEAEGCTVTENSGKNGYAAHTYGNWTVTQAATSTAAGSRYRDCTVCAYRETASIPATGGSSSSGGGGGGGGSSASSSIKVPVSGDRNSVQVNASVSGTTATVSNLSATQLNTIAGSNVKTGMVEIDLSGLKRTIQAANLPVDTIKEIARAAADESNDTKGLTIKLSSGEVSFDAAALNEIWKQAGDQITLTVAPVSLSALNTRQKDIVGNAPVYDLTMRSGGKIIADFGRGYATVSIPYKLKQGQKPAGIVAYYLDNSGNIHACETMYDVRTETVIFTTGHLSLYFVGYDQDLVPEEPSRFVDVLSGAYYYDAVAWAVEKGITAGTGSATFSPNAPCTRAQIVTFLWRAAGSPSMGGNNPFTDVAPGSYYYDAVQWAVAQGITSGTSTTTFSPDATCTRGQTVTFLYRYKNSPAVSGSNAFTDVFGDAYYANAVQWAVMKGITSGTGATTFSPGATCTRGQIVTFLYRSAA